MDESGVIEDYPTTLCAQLPAPKVDDLAGTLTAYADLS